MAHLLFPFVLGKRCSATAERPLERLRRLPRLSPLRQADFKFSRAVFSNWGRRLAVPGQPGARSPKFAHELGIAIQTLRLMAGRSRAPRLVVLLVVFCDSGASAAPQMCTAKVPPPTSEMLMMPSRLAPRVPNFSSSYLFSSGLVPSNKNNFFGASWSRWFVMSAKQ
jgi:hypothetical protein